MRPAVGRFEPGEQAHQRALAAARGPEQAEELALVDVEAEIVDGGERAEALGHAVETDERGGRRVPPGREVAAGGADGGTTGAATRSIPVNPIDRRTSGAIVLIGAEPACSRVFAQGLGDARFEDLGLLQDEGAAGALDQASPATAP